MKITPPSPRSNTTGTVLVINFCNAVNSRSGQTAYWLVSKIHSTLLNWFILIAASSVLPNIDMRSRLDHAPSRFHYLLQRRLSVCVILACDWQLTTSAFYVSVYMVTLFCCYESMRTSVGSVSTIFFHIRACACRECMFLLFLSNSYYTRRFLLSDIHIKLLTNLHTSIVRDTSLFHHNTL